MKRLKKKNKASKNKFPIISNCPNLDEIKKDLTKLKGGTGNSIDTKMKKPFKKDKFYYKFYVEIVPQ